MYQTKLNEIIDFATNNTFSDEVFQAKEEYANQVGKIYEDDQSYENRMSHFLEWYIFDRKLSGKTVTPILEFIENNKDKWDEKTLKGFTSLAQNIHGMFQVKKISKNHVLVFNFFDNNKYKVLEEQSHLIFRKKDLFEGRIIVETDGNYFTGTYFFHPQKSQSFIKKEIEKLTQILDKYTIDLKKIEKLKIRREKELGNLSSKLDVCKGKIALTSTETRLQNLKNKSQTLELQKNALIQSISKLNESVYELKTIKIETEGQQAQINLMHRFANMNLKWERFRKIDLKDIYKS